MQFRYARHTQNLKEIEYFYTKIIGLERIGGFQNHEGYDGVFLGIPSLHWHLEFTTSTDIPNHKFDEDDALVFYFNSDIELDILRKRLSINNIIIESSKNPYWNSNGIQISDPDGFKILFSIKEIQLQSKEDLTKLANEKLIFSWNQLLKTVKNIPYGRNENRRNLSLVLEENKGTCSSKHAFLKKIAEENSIDQVKLILGMFKMNSKNTPKIKPILDQYQLEYIPEAHCYLSIYQNKIDITNNQSDFAKIKNDILQEIEITPDQVNDYKVDYHQNFLKNWLKDQTSNYTFEELWEIREKCIKQLEA